MRGFFSASSIVQTVVLASATCYANNTVNDDVDAILQSTLVDNGRVGELWMPFERVEITLEKTTEKID